MVRDTFCSWPMQSLKLEVMQRGHLLMASAWRAYQHLQKAQHRPLLRFSESLLSMCPEQNSDNQSSMLACPCTRLLILAIQHALQHATKCHYSHWSAWWITYWSWMSDCCQYQIVHALVQHELHHCTAPRGSSYCKLLMACGPPLGPLPPSLHKVLE